MLIVGDFYPTNFISIDGSVNCTISTGRGVDDNSAVGLFDETLPITCGGSCGWSGCYNIIDGSEFATMQKKRSSAGSVMVNPSTMWILGGTCGTQNGYEHSLMPFTEFISSDPDKSGPGKICIYLNL